MTKPVPAGDTAKPDWRAAAAKRAEFQKHMGSKFGGVSHGGKEQANKSRATNRFAKTKT